MFLTHVGGTLLGKISVSVRFYILTLTLMVILVFWNVASSRLAVSVKFSTSIFLNDIFLNIMAYAPPPLPKYRQLLTGAQDVKSRKAAVW